MKTKTPKQSKRQVNDAIGISKEVADKFRAFCTTRKWQIAFSAEQALTAWMREQVRMSGAVGK